MTSTEWWADLKSITLHVEGESARLWPEGASPEYRAARMALVEAEKALRDQVEAVAAQRRSLPRGARLGPYAFTEGPADLAEDGPARRVTLEDLFEGHNQLLVYNLMLHPEDTAACAACSMFVDGMRGVVRHIRQHAGFAVVAPAPLDAVRGWGRARGWGDLRLVSAAGTTFTTDIGVAGSRGALFPAFSVYARDTEGVRHVLTHPADFPDGSWRGMDLLSPVWNALDILPSGRGDWDPDNTYPVA
ncbi:DUF899 family protein [Actinomycetes bacterium KLBMP 9759]